MQPGDLPRVRRWPWRCCTGTIITIIMRTTTPHREFWSAVLGLVRDGATFTHAKLREAHEQHRAGYEAVESEAGQAPAAKLPPGQQETSQEEPEGSSGDEEELVE